MGSLLLDRCNKPIGYILEKLNIEKPEIVLQAHKDYVDAGSDVVYTNTFGANSLKFDDKTLKDIIENGIQIAKKANPKYTALDVGPLGKVIGEGGLDFEEAVETFKKTISLANDQTDFIIIETMTSLAETRAAILAVKETSNLPLAVTMSFDENLRTFFGTSVECFCLTAEGLGADAIGANCSLGAIEMLPVAKEFVKYTNLPLIFKANAGMPRLENGKTVYDIDAVQFSDAMHNIKKLGVNILGGCCGTTPSYMKLVCEKSKNNTFPRQKADKKICSVCSQTMTEKIDSFKVVGERINPTGKKRVQQAVRENDFDFLISEGVKQYQQGANILDVNIGVSGIDEVCAMKKIITKLQNVVPLPLQIDSSKPEVLEIALRRYNGKAIINSVNGTEESLQAVLPLCKKYGAALIALTLDDDGIPKTCEKRVEIAQKIVARAKEYGISSNDIFVDALTMSEASGKGNAMKTLNALKMLKDLGLKTALGVSNVSFGMPNREDINAQFLNMAIESGLTLGIVNPSFIGLEGSIEAKNYLLGLDGADAKYLELAKAYIPIVPSDDEITLYDAILTGQNEKSGKLTKILLEKENPMSISSEHIIPALDKVGEFYESGKLFLPQLISAAESAKASFAEIEKAMEENSSDCLENKNTFLIATVKGDIHDIGKNIVKTVVSNYGFKIVDLGRDVDFDVIVTAVEKHYPCSLGLSALMTTTADNMAKTIKFVKEKFDIPILVGGAVLTKEYANQIGGIYCRDANDTVAKLRELYKI